MKNDRAGGWNKQRQDATEVTHVEPVDGTAVDEGRVLSQPVPEGVAYGTHGHYYRNVLSAPVCNVKSQDEATQIQQA